MNSKKIKKALQQIAKKEGISVEAVRREIELAITTAQENPTPEAQAFWNSIPHKGDKPTPEEVIAHIAGIVNDKSK